MAAKATVLAHRIEQCIFLLRGQKVMLSPDLARLYNFEPRALVQAVKRNLKRSPPTSCSSSTTKNFAA